MRSKMSMTTIAGLAMMQAGLMQAGVAAAEPVGRAPTSGIVSNRAALGLPVGTVASACVPTSEARISCAASADSSELRSKSGSIVVALAAVAAVGAGIAIAAKGDGSRSSAPITPISP